MTDSRHLNLSLTISLPKIDTIDTYEVIEEYFGNDLTAIRHVPYFRITEPIELYKELSKIMF